MVKEVFSFTELCIIEEQAAVEGYLGVTLFPGDIASLLYITDQMK